MGQAYKLFITFIWLEKHHWSYSQPLICRLPPMPRRPKLHIHLYPRPCAWRAAAVTLSRCKHGRPRLFTFLTQAQESWHPRHATRWVEHRWMLGMERRVWIADYNGTPCNCPIWTQDILTILLALSKFLSSCVYLGAHLRGDNPVTSY